MSQVKCLCVMDVDGTLILEEVIDLWEERQLVEEEISQITSRAMRGELDFESSLRKRVSLLAGLPVSVFEKSSTLFIYRQMLRNSFLFSKRMPS